MAPSEPIQYAVVSAKSGVGKSSFALNVAVFLSSIGKRVALVTDASTYPDICLMQGIEPLPDQKAGIVHEVHGTLNVCFEVAGGNTYDHIIWDVQPSRALDWTWLESIKATALCLATPDPASIYRTHRWLMGKPKSVQTTSDHLIVNRVREREHIEQGEAMVALLRRHVGLNVDWLGHVEHDEAYLLAVQRQQPLVIHNPAAKSTRSVEKILRKLLVGHRMQAMGKRATVDTPDQGALITHYDVLDISRRASDDDVRHAFHKVRDYYRDKPCFSLGLLSEDDRQRMQRRIQEAYEILMEQSRRRVYDLSIFGVEAAESRVSSLPPSAKSSVLPMPEIFADTEFTGDLLRSVREAMGIDVAAISKRIKIRQTYLEAIEHERFAELPEWPYARGFVSEYAKALRLDPTHVTRTYMKRLKRYLESSASFRTP